MNTPSNIKLDYLESQVISSKSEQTVGSENKWLLLANLESACSLIAVPMRFLERVVGTPWHFYDK